MAHEITAQDNVALAEKGAWHGIGNILPEAMTTKEAITAAGLDWEVKVLPQFYAVPGSFDPETPKEEQVEGNEGAWESQYSRTVVRMPRPGVMDREGNPEQFIELSSVGPEWKPIQNAQMFDMVDYALGQGVRLESAGSFQQGRKVFALLKSDSFAAGGAGNDQVSQYLLLANGHDAQFTFRAIPTSVRVVCMNTLKMALTGRGMLTLRHVGDTEGRLKDMGTALQTFKATGKLFQEKVDFLAKKELTAKKLEKFWKEAWTIVHSEDELPEDEKAVQEMKNEIEAWSTSMEIERLELEMQKSTIWLAANAITKSIQHGEPKRKTQGWAEGRQVSNLFGKNDEITTKVMQAALALA